MRIALVTVFSRFLIFCFWVFLIGVFLFIPRIYKYIHQDRSLTVFTWPLLLDPIYLKNFEKETGIKLYITYFENGAALLSKMAATNGQGYDIILPDDHYLQLLIKQNLVKKIDRTKLSFWNKLDPNLLGVYSDLDNLYSIPYYWGFYALGYNTNTYYNKTLPESWSVLFDNSFCPHARICMTDDPREAILITAQYLFGTIDALKQTEAREKIKQELIRQKKFIEVYTISRADILLQNNSCGLALIMSPELQRLVRDYPMIQSIIPQEGTFAIVDSIAIPITTNKDEMIYQFLNYLYRPEVIHHHTSLYGYCSPLALEDSIKGDLCSMNQFSNFNFFKNSIPDDIINSLWIEVLAA